MRENERMFSSGASAAPVLREASSFAPMTRDPPPVVTQVSSLSREPSSSPPTRDPTATGSHAVRESAAAAAPAPAVRATAPAANLKESVLSSELTVEGKIQGAGNVRLAGRFKGDVHVRGNVVVEQGAVVTGEIKADVVIISGQVEGNIEAATRVELQPTGILNGDVISGTLTVAAGSRMRGRVEFGWTDRADVIGS